MILTLNPLTICLDFEQARQSAWTLIKEVYGYKKMVKMMEASDDFADETTSSTRGDTTVTLEETSAMQEATPSALVAEDTMPEETQGNDITKIAAPVFGAREFVVDSGSSFDIVDLKSLSEKEKAAIEKVSPQSMMTAGGLVKARETTKVSLANGDKVITPYILPNTPHVISLGKRCMEEGYTFE